MASKEASTSSTEHFIFFQNTQKKNYVLLKFSYVTAGEMGLVSYPTSQNMLEKQRRPLQGGVLSRRWRATESIERATTWQGFGGEGRGLVQVGFLVRERSRHGEWAWRGLDSLSGARGHRCPAGPCQERSAELGAWTLDPPRGDLEDKPPTPCQAHACSEEPASSFRE